MRLQVSCSCIFVSAPIAGEGLPSTVNTNVLQDKSSNSFILFVQALSQIQSEIVTGSEIA